MGIKHQLKQIRLIDLEVKAKMEELDRLNNSFLKSPYLHFESCSLLLIYKLVLALYMPFPDTSFILSSDILIKSASLR